MKNQWKYFLCLFILALPLHGQFVVKGKIRTVEKEAITNANVVCKSLGNKIHSYTFTDSEGYYELNIKATGNFVLEFSSLGFEKQSSPLKVSSVSARAFTLDIVLNKSVVVLDEVILIDDKPIDIRKDTIVFDADAFSRGSEEVVEDILKNLPNVSVDRDGSIRVGNTEIEKVMIEGDDFFKRGYKMITKNMPSKSIDKVEVINNFLENDLLKDIQDSDKIALNLRLKEEAKRIWFGNVGIAHGLTTSDNYEFSTILMNYGKKNKYYFYSNFNDIGHDAKGYLDGLTHSINYDDLTAIGEGQRAHHLLQLDPIPVNLKKERTNFNNSELISLNAIFNPVKRLKISTNGFLSWDENKFFRRSAATVDIPGTKFINTENRDLFKNSALGFMEVDLELELTQNASLMSSSRFSKNENNGLGNLSFNTSTAIETLETKTSFMDHSIRFTKKFEGNRILLFSGRYINEDVPQYYTINDLFYPELFPQITEADHIVQNSKNKLNLVAFEVQWLTKQKKGHLLEFQIGDQYRKDIFASNLILMEGMNIVDLPPGYQNNLEYASNDLYLKAKYTWKTRQLGFNGSLEFHQLANRIRNELGTANETPFFINTRIGFDWSPGDKSSLKGVYTFSNSNAGILDVYDNYALTAFQSFLKGTGTFNQLAASNFLISYKLGNWSDRFFANTVLLYLRNHDFFSSSMVVDPNYSLSERLMIKDRDLLNINTKIDYYISAFSSNIKLDLGYSRLNYGNIVNNSELREVLSVAYNYGLQLRSGFRGKLNFHAGTKWTNHRIKTMMTNAYTDNITFLDLSYNGGGKFNFEMKAERYFFGNLDKRNNTYYFLDFALRYTLRPNKLELSLNGSNLFNTRTYRNFTISDIGTYNTEFKLLPSYLLLKFKYRFGLP